MSAAIVTRGSNHGNLHWCQHLCCIATSNKIAHMLQLQLGSIIWTIHVHVLQCWLVCSLWCRAACYPTHGMAHHNSHEHKSNYACVTCFTTTDEMFRPTFIERSLVLGPLSRPNYWPGKCAIGAVTHCAWPHRVDHFQCQFPGPFLGPRS
jgi:hypothetical protein